MRMEEILKGIRPADVKAMEQARLRWDGLAKPLGSLGLLEEMVIRIAGISGKDEVCLDRRELLIFCADNGVVAREIGRAHV